MIKLKKQIWGAKTSLLHAWGRLSAGMRANPNFLIIGAQKGGTSSLFYYLKFHPQIHRPIKKEIHYFNLFYDKGPAWYLAHFPRKSSKLITGEATPAYMFHPLAPQRIKEFNPDIKLIALLREPVQRAYSAFQMNKRLGIDPRPTFEKAILYELDSLEKNDQTYSHDRHNFYYLERGKYAQQLSELSKYFGPNQLLLINSHAFFEDPKASLTSVYDFLGIENIYPKEYKVMNLGQYPPLSQDIYEKVVKYFTEDLQTLKDHWGINLTINGANINE